jgi:hypothetical protein
VAEYLITHQERVQRILVVTYFLGIFGWLYYQIMSTIYSLSGTVAAPPLVYESHRAGEALMVVASIFVFVAYGHGLSLRTKNRRQRTRAVAFWATTGVIFTTLLFTDYWLDSYDPALASAIRQASQGIGWIFQFGMGYTFYLPFALYIAGLLCWAYTVVKLLMMGRVAGYGLGLMFIAGYALMFSNLTLMVVLGIMLLTLDRIKPVVVEPLAAPNGRLLGASEGPGNLLAWTDRRQHQIQPSRDPRSSSPAISRLPRERKSPDWKSCSRPNRMISKPAAVSASSISARGAWMMPSSR